MHAAFNLVCHYRIFCSNLHFNENAKRLQAQTTNGENRWSIVYPKAHKGEKAVAKPIKELPTYSKHCTYFVFYLYNIAAMHNYNGVKSY